MNEEDFRRSFQNLLNISERVELCTTIPADSGVVRVANVPPEKFDTGFISTRPGRFKQDGALIKYWGDKLPTCFGEIGFPQPPQDFSGVCEIGYTRYEAQAFDISKIPEFLKNAIYSEHGENKWNKSHIVADELDKNPRFRGIEITIYPSASGKALEIGGACLAVKGNSEFISTVATGSIQDIERKALEISSNNQSNEDSNGNENSKVRFHN